MNFSLLERNDTINCGEAAMKRHKFKISAVVSSTRMAEALIHESWSDLRSKYFNKLLRLTLVRH